MAQLEADFSIAHQCREEPRLARRQADEDLPIGHFHGRHVVELAVQLEAAAELMEWHVRT